MIFKCIYIFRYLWIIIFIEWFWITPKNFFVPFFNFLLVYFLYIKPQRFILLGFVLFLLLWSWHSSSIIMFFYKFHRFRFEKITKALNDCKLGATDDWKRILFNWFYCQIVAIVLVKSLLIYFYLRSHKKLNDKFIARINSWHGLPLLTISIIWFASWFHLLIYYKYY